MSQLDSNGCLTAIGQLTSLQQISLAMIGDSSAPEITSDCLQTLSTLEQLTMLQLDGVSFSSDLRLLPVQLQQLVVKYKGGVTDPGPAAQADQ